MRKDFDYVSFGDYQHDMKEAVEQATRYLSNLREEISKRDRFIHTLIVACGGKVVIPDHLLQSDEGRFISYYNPSDMTTTYEVI